MIPLPGFRDFLQCDTVYAPDQIGDIILRVRPHFKIIKDIWQNKTFNVPCALDIETTSFIDPNGEKTGIMYEWTFGIYGAVIIGRTWDEFENLMSGLSKILGLGEKKRLIVYVHNLKFEFGFICTHFKWIDVFAVAVREPLYALTDLGIEFRCSYMLSGYGLESLGDNLTRYDVHKQVGKLNYNLPRHSKTPLSGAEIVYCADDVRVVMAYIAERIETDGDITKIPLTKTGYVRRYCRNRCLYETRYKRHDYRELMQGMKITGVEEYAQLKRAFMGGFTHSNSFRTNLPIYGVTSYDITSSYSAVMVAEKFPISSAEQITISSQDEFEKNLSLYCCLFDVEFFGLQSIQWQEHYLIYSRVWDVQGAVYDAGRIVSADHLRTTVTEQDFSIIRKFYTCKNFRVYNFRRYRRGYLPTAFIKSIIELYVDKTSLKNVKGQELVYAQKKEQLNACYGMTVTDIIQDLVTYTDKWEQTEKKIPEEIEKYNNDPNRFLFYPWGVWITAYARRNLFTAINAIGEDYIYADTDSVKCVNAPLYQPFFDAYNNNMRERLKTAMKFHGLPESMIEPTTIDGDKKLLGAWDFDGHYKTFKTLGAKLYIVEYSTDARNREDKRGKIVVTAAGLGKNAANKWITKSGTRQAFAKFKTGMIVPGQYTGKLIHTYIDTPRQGTLKDYTGITANYDELSGVHLDESDYSLSIDQEYSDFLRGIKHINW